MQKLIELAQKIKNEELKKKVIEFLKNPSLSNKDFKKYPMTKLEEAKTLFSAVPGTVVERDVLNHTIALADLCLKTAETAEKVYGIPIDKDSLIAAAILHDLMHLYEYKKSKGEVEHTGIMLDHTILGVAEFYQRGFPESVIHIIASHAGEQGTTPPRNFEALIFHQLDSMLASIEFHFYGSQQSQQPVQLVLLDEETIKKMTGEMTEKKTK